MADTSIMPVIVNGNTNAPAIMIGEKVADFVREYWTGQSAFCPRIPYYLEGPLKQCHYARLF